MSEKDIIICRCEDISRQEIRQWLEKGYTSFEDLKRQLRVGMGPCQGQTCAELIKREIASFLHTDHESVPIHKQRPLVVGVKLKAIAEAGKDER